MKYKVKNLYSFQKIISVGASGCMILLLGRQIIIQDNIGACLSGDSIFAFSCVCCYLSCRGTELATAVVRLRPNDQERSDVEDLFEPS